MYRYINIILSPANKAAGYVIVGGKRHPVSKSMDHLRVASLGEIPIGVGTYNDGIEPIAVPVTVDVIDMNEQRADNLINFIDVFDDEDKDCLVRAINSYTETRVHVGLLPFVARHTAIYALKRERDFSQMVQNVVNRRVDNMIRILDIQPEWIDVTTIGDNYRKEMHIVTGETRNLAWDYGEELFHGRID